MELVIMTPAMRPRRTFLSTGMEMAAEEHAYRHDDGTLTHRAWFVVDRKSWFAGDRPFESRWHTHCGPYSTREQAHEWIEAIREVKPKRLERAAREAGR